MLYSRNKNAIIGEANVQELAHKAQASTPSWEAARHEHTSTHTRTLLSPVATAAPAPGHGLRRAQPPDPSREPPHRHLPRLGLPRGVPRFVSGASPLPPLPAPAAHVPFQQRRRGPAPPPVGALTGRRLRRRGVRRDGAAAGATHEEAAERFLELISGCGSGRPAPAAASGGEQSTAGGCAEPPSAGDARRTRSCVGTQAGQRGGHRGEAEARPLE